EVVEAVLEVEGEAGAGEIQLEAQLLPHLADGARAAGLPRVDAAADAEVAQPPPVLLALVPALDEQPSRLVEQAHVHHDVQLPLRQAVLPPDGSPGRYAVDVVEVPHLHQGSHSPATCPS